MVAKLQQNPASQARQDALASAAANDEIGYAARTKWGGAVDAGFVQVPDVLLRAQRLLDLDTVDLAIVLNILMHWWAADDLPFPRPAVIARRIGVSTRTVERRVARLQQRDLITRKQPERYKGKLTIRRFDPAGLVGALERLAAKNLADRPPKAIRDHELA